MMLLKAIVFASFFLSIPAYGFLFISGSYSKGARPVSDAPVWASRTLTFYINTDQATFGGSISPELTSDQFRSAAITAIDRWASICNSDVRIADAGTTSTQKSSTDNTNVIAWDNRTTAEGNAAADSSILATAFVSITTTGGRLTDCDILINGEATGTFGVGGEATKYDLISTLVHEIGHCLGLDHNTQPPTFTGSNPIFSDSPMKSTINLGSIVQRTLSQDETDGMSCSNGRQRPDREGYFCSSYHGTNNNGAISGTVSGGPTEVRKCGVGIASAISKGGASGSGCINKAFAHTENQSHSSATWILELVLMTFVYLIFKVGMIFKKKFFFFILILLSLNAQADILFFELGGEFRYSNPRLLNKASELVTNDGTFAKYGNQELFNQIWNLKLNLLTTDKKESTFVYGARILYFYPTIRDHTGLNDANVIKTIKATELVGYSAGPMARLQFGIFFMEAGINLGKMYFNQTIENASDAKKSLIEASSTSVEGFGNIGVTLEVFDHIDFLVKAGYSRLRTNAMSADKIEGTRYQGIVVGDRLAVSDGIYSRDLIIDLSGFMVSASFSIWL